MTMPETPPPPMPPRDLEAEFSDISQRVKSAVARRKALARKQGELDDTEKQEQLAIPEQMEALTNEYANLLIDTLQQETDTTKWTDLAKKFPSHVCVYTMTDKNLRKKFLKRLKLKADVVDRWTAAIELDGANRRATTDEANDELEACKSRCEKLMVKLLEAEQPQTVPELREIMEGAYDYRMQEMFLPGLVENLKRLNLPCLQEKKDFTAFAVGVHAGQLHDRYVTRPSLKTSKEYHTYMASQSKKLAIMLFKNEGYLAVPDSHHPLMLQYLVCQRQHLLHATLNAEIGLEEFARVWETPLDQVVNFTPVVTQGRVPASKLREWAYELKQELDPETDVTRLVQLFKGLWRMAMRRQCIKKRRQAARNPEVVPVKRPINPKTLWLKARSREWRHELPLRIMDAVINGGPENLDTRLVNALHQLPRKVIISTLRMHKVKIIQDSDDNCMLAVAKAIKFLETTYG